MTILHHYSKQPIGELKRYSPVPDNCHKPGGLWLSDETQYGWRKLLLHLLSTGAPDWGDANELMSHVAVFSMNTSNILMLKTEDDLSQFSRQYGELQHRSCNDGQGLHIRWGEIKNSYKGILISPYQKAFSHRHGDPFFHWYRFDCASVCVWDTSCLTRLAYSGNGSPTA